MFSRFNFQVAIDDLPETSGGLTLEFDENQNFHARTFMGLLVNGKDEWDTQTIAQCILTIVARVIGGSWFQ